MEKPCRFRTTIRQCLAFMVLALGACAHTSRPLAPAQSALVHEKFQKAVLAKLDQENKIFSSLNISRIERTRNGQLKVEYQVSYLDNEASTPKKRNSEAVAYQYAGIATLQPSQTHADLWEVVSTAEQSHLIEFKKPVLIWGFK